MSAKVRRGVIFGTSGLIAALGLATGPSGGCRQQERKERASPQLEGTYTKGGSAMFETIKKSLLASLGAAVVTKEKVEEATRHWVDEGKISTEEAERLAQELVESGRHQWEDMQTRISETVRKGLATFDIGSKKEFQELQEKVEQLEKRLQALEEAQQGTEE
ncbi:MAG: phasin family protein [Deltaproteobacteria bacterium]|nr:phasin family protein [Deltaproteobacteria bacterium]MBW2072179.1 phasin family protein [Deltaproteobacteria bacterium]